jgi:hypothetical protein
MHGQYKSCSTVKSLFEVLLPSVSQNVLSCLSQSLWWFDFHSPGQVTAIEVWIIPDGRVETVKSERRRKSRIWEIAYITSSHAFLTFSKLYRATFLNTNYTGGKKNFHLFRRNVTSKPIFTRHDKAITRKL